MQSSSLEPRWPTEGDQYAFLNCPCIHGRKLENYLTDPGWPKKSDLKGYEWYLLDFKVIDNGKGDDQA